ncbi:NADP-dependent oxidoreductase domain-containing protein [Schizophyllum commune]
MCHWRRVQNVYQRCGHVENMIECGSSRCKFSAYHPPTCQPPSCTKTCLQYRTYPEHYICVGSVPWSHLARGRLSRPLDRQTKRGETDRSFGVYSKAKESTEAIVNRVEELAKKKGCSMAPLSLAWIMSKPGVTAPIVGTTSLENLQDLIGAVDIELSEEDVKYLEEPYHPQAIIGHW